LYVRDGVLMAYDPATAQERPLASAVSTFAATADGRTLALVRSSEGLPHDIWLIERDGSNLRQVTADARTEGDLSWAPDGQTLAYASSQRGTPRPLDLMQWSSWCANSEVRLLDSASGQVTPLEPGCEPAFSNDGRRIAFTTPPQQTAYAAEGETAPGETNTIRLVNRQGENGWSFTTA
jgi:Tol biopolymer transport system component